MDQSEAPETPALFVCPHPDLAERGESLAGVPAEGAEVPYELAQEWLAAGLATTTPPAPPASDVLPDLTAGDPGDDSDTDPELGGEGG